MASTIDWVESKGHFHAWTVTQDSTEQKDFLDLESAIKFCLDNEEILNGNGRDLGEVRIFIPTEKFATSPTFMFYLEYIRQKNAGTKQNVLYSLLTEAERQEFRAERDRSGYCKNVFAVLNGEKRRPKAEDFFFWDGNLVRSSGILDEVPIFKLVNG